MKTLLKIKKWRIFIVTLAVAWFCARPALAQPIRVVATFPDLADITRQIGKNLVSVESLATGVEDPHGVPMKPSFVPRLNRANILVVTGSRRRAFLAAGAARGGEQSENPSGSARLHRLLGGYSSVWRLLRGLIAPKGICIQREIHIIFWTRPTGKSPLRTLLPDLARSFPQYQADFDKNLKAYLGGARQLDQSLGKNGGAAPRCKICGIPSGMGLLRQPLRSEAGR